MAVLRVLSRRYRALEAADAGMRALPVAVALRVAAYLEAAAAGQVADVHAGGLRELVDEFIKMQRVVRPHFGEHACETSALSQSKRVYRCSPR